MHLDMSYLNYYKPTIKERKLNRGKNTTERRIKLRNTSRCLVRKYANYKKM